MSELALALIAENKKSKAKQLDLGNCGLTEIPAGIGELTWLESLSLANTWWEWNGQDWQRQKSQNKGPSNNLDNLNPIAGLAALQDLVVSGPMVADLTPLASLRALRRIEVSR